MNTSKNSTYSLVSHLRMALLGVMTLWVCAVMAHDPSKYAAASVLADGKWGKVAVGQPGIQFISAATLRQLGFNDPTKVNVYGFGGRLSPDALLLTDPDDLPLLPSVKSDKGVWFFGHDYITWSRTGSSSGMPLSHTMHPYAEESWYFVSDREVTPAELPQASLPTTLPARQLADFWQPLLHEEDTYHPSSSGRIYLGEDFRATPNRKFTFPLTDRSENEYRISVSLAGKANTATDFTISIDGGKSTTAAISTLGTSQGEFLDTYLSSTSVNMTGVADSDNATVNIAYRSAGNVLFARLDYIELAYRRRIALRDGQIYFNTMESVATTAVISNASAGMRIWDVTDHIRPMEVSYTLSGSTASFAAPGGYHEYVAFSPMTGGYAVSNPTAVENQNLHALNSPDLLIIAPFEYLAAANTLAAHHREWDGLTVEVLTPEVIYNEFTSGTPDVGAFRRLMKMWYDRADSPASDEDAPRGRIQYCLILSRPTYDNKARMEATRNCGYPRIPIWQSPSGTSTETSFPCDDYIGMLRDSKSAADFTLGSEKLQVAVGRMPVTSVSEASAMVTKYLNYVTTPDPGRWRNQMLLIADDDETAHLTQTEDCYSSIISTPRGANFEIEKLYLDSFQEAQGSTGFTTPQVKERLLRKWNEGVNFINYIGHASTVGWTHEDLLNWNDLQNFSNKHLPFLYAATCEFARYDQDTQSGAEVLWANPSGGIIATVCPTRTVLIKPNGSLSKAFSEALFDSISMMKQGRRIGDIYRTAKNNYPSSDQNKLRFAILGDPAMRFSLPENVISITELAGVDFTQPDHDTPELPARGKPVVAGVVTDADGNVDTSFNGTIEIVLYDAEKVYTTLGQHSGNILNYNDFKNMIYRGMTKVTEGRWSTTLLIPAEIENLYNQASIVFYAYTPEGREAHGRSTDLYVYGYDDNAPEDNHGPEIHYFALNREDFADGSVVHSSPVAMAKVSDESGINISDAGIGHQITLTLDGRTTFSDVNIYYSPDPDDATMGTLLYPLPELSAGEHTLRLTVWDNANNSATADLTFNVAAAKRPEIYELRTDVNPARENVTFTVSTDRPMADVACRIEVFDLNGRRVWTSDRATSTDMMASLSVYWNLCNSDGVRVPRGIYLYRATITSPDGTSATSSRKLAVTAQ